MGDTWQVDREIGGTRACVEGSRANGVLYLQRDFTNNDVFSIVCNDFRVLDGRFGDFRLRRVARYPNSQDGRTFGDVDRYVRSNDDYRPLQREMRRFQIGGNGDKGIIEVGACRLLLDFFVSGRVVSNCLDDHSNDNERYGNERDLIFYINGAFREFCVNGLQVVRRGAGAFDDVCEETAARDCGGIDSKDLMDLRAVLCVNGDQICFGIAMRFVEGIVDFGRFSGLDDRPGFGGVFIYSGRDFPRSAANDLCDGCAATTNSRVKYFVWCGAIRGFVFME